MSVEYNEYLNQHIANVQRGYDWLITHFPDLLKWMSGYEYILKIHDNSKYTPEEYDAYDRYFYGKNRSFEVVKDFNYAWLHHIHHNPHHWQFWILQHDDEPEEILEMPMHYIIEMICDWWSFSWKTGNLNEIFDWYEKHKNMKLGKETRKKVEYILELMKIELNKSETGDGN